MKSVCNINDYIFNGKFKLLSRFGVIGVMNTLIDFLVFTMFNEFTYIGYIGSQILGYGFGVLNSFIFNKKWTFKERSVNKKIIYEFLQFVIVNIISLIITIGAMRLLVSNLNINVYIAKVMVTLIAQIVNFLSYKFLVFN
ncbi:Putative flippase GtrA (transmembrane translocase of bactoprenol-linked glucose) [Clostridium cavendishii DSM 21758]|uniref:Putative flippase GtrA (Transmembrane translocase of bactoprenol-linked glucose) n=1 Tax=Clostridium cavendishii DSM 21758 TaxID=1121302 RepID=A0A1M6HXX1_9CLOT|nr:GtrA family protein [Clostridium cavendishii]SHJ27070.1 Putative flippase GtrA (transmembrane translocase of bactoprenol-linked glucose) [Clostridium cavendishii DSM 21758]